MDADQPLTELYERWWGGRATGEAFKTFFALAKTKSPLHLGTMPYIGLGAGASVPLDPGYVERAIYTVAGEVEIAAGQAANVAGG
jgi:hypothetical protein